MPPPPPPPPMREDDGATRSAARMTSEMDRLLVIISSCSRIGLGWPRIIYHPVARAKFWTGRKRSEPMISEIKVWPSPDKRDSKAVIHFLSDQIIESGIDSNERMAT